MEVKGKETASVLCLSKYVDLSSEESHRYYLARRNGLQMLRDRGYEVSDEDINLSLHDFRTVYGERPDVDRLRISALHRSDSTKKVYRSNFVFVVIFRFLAVFFVFACCGVYCLAVKKMMEYEICDSFKFLIF